MLKRVALKTVIVNLLFLLLFFYFLQAFASPSYGEIWCKNEGYRCFDVKRGDSWAQLFPNPVQRDIVKRVNRMNVFLKPGMVIAIPSNLKNITLNDVAPFPPQRKSNGEKMVLVNLNAMAWAAYDQKGHLVKWGPASTGKAFCPDVKEGCATPVGVFRVIRKQGENCISSVFPERLNGEKGGAAMPYCIHFYKGYALHGSDELTGHASSHGCVNLFNSDAQWLNQHFIDIPEKGKKGTLVVIEV